MAFFCCWLLSAARYTFVFRPFLFPSWSYLLYNRADCTSECFLCFLPWKRPPPCLMTMAPRLRVSSSAWAMLCRALSYESSVAFTVIFFWITPRHDSSSAALRGGRTAGKDSDLTERSGLILHVIYFKMFQKFDWCIQLLFHQLVFSTTKYTAFMCSLLLFIECVILATAPKLAAAFVSAVKLEM